MQCGSFHDTLCLTHAAVASRRLPQPDKAMWHSACISLSHWQCYAYCSWRLQWLPMLLCCKLRAVSCQLPHIRCTSGTLCPWLCCAVQYHVLGAPWLCYDCAALCFERCCQQLLCCDASWLLPAVPLWQSMVHTTCVLCAVSQLMGCKLCCATADLACG